VPSPPHPRFELTNLDKVHQLRRARRSPITKILRALLHLTPSALIIAVIAAPQIPYVDPWMLWILATLITLSLGIFDGLLSSEVPKSEGSPKIKELLHHSVQFLAVAMMVFPLVCAAGFVIFEFVPMFFR